MSGLALGIGVIGAAGYYAGSGGWWDGKDSSIKTKQVVDPTKFRVSDPLSKYLASSIGKGLPRYEGPLYSELDETYTGYKDFLSLDSGEWFDEAIGDPETKRFKEEFLPQITEGFAGSLRGSGRFRAEEAGIGQFSDNLAQTRAKAIPALEGKQFNMASQIKAQKDKQYMLEYRDWMKSLPEMNPNLDRALSFLGKPTGIDTLAFLDQGQEGSSSDIMSLISSLAMIGAFA